jgi:hypothetical protein
MFIAKLGLSNIKPLKGPIVPLVSTHGPHYNIWFFTCLLVQICAVQWSDPQIYIEAQLYA